MKKVEIENYTSCSFLGRELIKEIYKVAYKLGATTVIVRKARYNKFAELELFEGNDCIDWNYTISV